MLEPDNSILEVFIVELSIIAILLSNSLLDKFFLTKFKDISSLIFFANSSLSVIEGLNIV